MGRSYDIVRWDGEQPPTERGLRALLEERGLDPCRWANGPGDVYHTHRHSYHKVLYVVTGSIRFGFPNLNRWETLNPGDRLELEAGVRHNAVVGRNGVVCLEAHAPRDG